MHSYISRISFYTLLISMTAAPMGCSNATFLYTPSVVERAQDRAERDATISIGGRRILGDAQKATSDNPSVAKVTQQDSVVTIEGVGRGVATITFVKKDGSKGATDIIVK